MPDDAPPGIPATLRELGGFFSWQDTTDGLMPLTAALAEPALPARFTAMRQGLARAAEVDVTQVHPRTAVSAVQIGLVSRLWSVALAAALLHGWVPDLRAELLRCGPGHRNPVPLASVAPQLGQRVRTPAQIAAAVAALVLDAAITDVDRACARLGATSEQVFASNTASALVSAARVLGGTRPAVAADAEQVVRMLLGQPRLTRGGGYLVGGEFRRRGCCLYYRLPGHGVCLDCVLVRPRRTLAGQHAGCSRSMGKR